jgi:aflatoxin B1 aldehyde reductase
MPEAPITNIIFGTMTLGYRGYAARVHDAMTADAMLGAVLEFGHDQLDTCSDYGDGTCEQMLGDLRAAERFGIATRIHPGNTRGHEPENLKRIFKESLARLKTGKVKILYMVTRDSATPIESTLSAVQELHDEGLFEEFGVSNFSAWQVAEASRQSTAVSCAAGLHKRMREPSARSGGVGRKYESFVYGREVRRWRKSN